MSSLWPGSALNRPSCSSSSSSSSSPMLPCGNIPATAQGSSQPSWVDEFLNYSAAKRCHHRRSVSDSIAFLEAVPPLVEDDGSRIAGELDRFDDDQLLSIFSYEMADVVVAIPPPSSSSGIPALSASHSSHSDHNINNEEQPAGGTATAATNGPEEAQSAYKMDMAAAEQPAGSCETIIADPKRVKRILANRQSAQRSRVRKLQYISELERSVTTLQSEVAALSPRVAFLDRQRAILTVGNSQLKQRIAALAQDKIFKDAHQEALRKELGRLRQVYNQQNLEKMATPTSESIACIEKELLSPDIIYSTLQQEFDC